jgi:GT2 family glycosyltransferase
MDVSIIIVNYNTKELLFNCLDSIFKQTKELSFEVIVVDNNSEDGSVLMIKKNFPSVLLIENNNNIGFGAANNKARALSSGKYVFFLNSDTILLNNAVKIFFDYWEKEGEIQNLGALGANLLDGMSNVTHSFGNFPTIMSSMNELGVILRNVIVKTLFRFAHCSYRSLRKKNESKLYYGDVGYITGAALFMRNGELANFDERFFLYFEETDMQYRLKKAHKRRMIIDGPQIIHLCGGSNKESDDVILFASFSLFQFNISRIKYLRKHYGSNKLGIILVKTILLLLYSILLIYVPTRKYMKLLIKV